MIKIKNAQENSLQETSALLSGVLNHFVKFIMKYEAKVSLYKECKYILSKKKENIKVILLCKNRFTLFILYYMPVKPNIKYSCKKFVILYN
jgi:hypothetical protein